MVWRPCMCALRGTARTPECPCCFASLLLRSRGGPLALAPQAIPRWMSDVRTITRGERVGKMISCSRHDTKACFPMNCHARISHCQGHAHRGEKRAKLIPRTYKQKRPAGTRSQLRHGAVQKGLGGCFPNKQNGHFSRKLE